MDIAGISANDIIQVAEKIGFSGAISVSPLAPGASLDLAFGFADRSNRLPNTIDTRFAMASGCKIFTAVAIGLLIEEGRIALDARLSDCLRTRGFPFGDQVTIRQLLNHTSGVPDYFSEEVEQEGFGEGGGYADLWRERPCYDMKSISDFLRPCGMTRSAYFAMDALPENTALGYVHRASGESRTNNFSVPAIGGPDGGAFTTIGDMRRFWTTLLAGRLLSQKTLDSFLAPAVPVAERGGSWHYDYGANIIGVQRKRLAAA